MKKLLVISLVQILVAFTANAQPYTYDVNNDGYINVTDVTNLVNKILGLPNSGEGQDDSPLQLATKTLNLTKGFSEEVEIISGSGSYTVYSSNVAVAIATIINTSITVTATGEGSTFITVTDTENGQAATIKVVVDAPSYLSCPDSNHPHIIDLGLPSGTKWACCNVDTDHPENQTPTNYGGHYAWGETDTKSIYSSSTYNHCDGSDLSFHYRGPNISGTQFDVAHVKWGSHWLIPSSDQIDELLSCTTEWTTQNGVNGCKFTGPNGGSIFLPAAGDFRDGSLQRVGSYGGYWSSTYYPSNLSYADCLGLISSINECGFAYRPIGRSVRPVFDKTIRLSATKVEMTVDESVTVSIISGSGRYQVSAYDANVVRASLSGTTVKLNGVSSGTATITIIDTAYGNTQTISVTVSVVPPSYLTCPDSNHPHIIDLGLPSGTKWACCNVDIDNPEKQSPTSYGGYYAWGETETKFTYDRSTYIYGYPQGDSFPLGSCISGMQFDVAHMKWGSLWQMPTKSQIDELHTNCTTEWITQDGVNGRKFTASNGGSIFLPAAGYYNGANLRNVGSNCDYWSGTQHTSINNYASNQYSPSSSAGTGSGYRYYGYTVRPVIGNYNSLIISSSKLSLIAGNCGLVNIISGSGNYNVESSNTRIATVKVTNNKVIVTTIDAGIATITVTDTQSNETATIIVTVTPASCPDSNHPHLVDLGLPSGTKWACCNVGATTPEEHGNYYAWGETETKDEYMQSTYNYVNLGSNIAGTQYDVAYVKWGGLWQMPTKTQFDELRANCTFEWTTQNGISGSKFTASNGFSIFLPAAGYRINSYINNYGSYGYYWSSTSGYSDGAYNLLFFSRSTSMSIYEYYKGQSVRPVSRN